MENSTDITNLIIEEFKISMETTSCDASCINGKDERHNRSIYNMVRSGLMDNNQHTNKWCCAEETPSEVHI